MASRLSSSEISSLAVSLTLRWLAMRSAQPLSAWTASNRQYTPEDATRLAQRFARMSGGVLRPSGTEDDGDANRILRTLRALDEEVDRYEDPQLQEMALDLVPFDALHARAEAIQHESQGSSSPSAAMAFQDALAQALVEWARQDFLRWVDPVRCSVCKGETQASGSAEPTYTEENEGGAGRIELYRCLSTDCARTTRFPRYTKLEKLLKTRTGRCGEFAAIFMLLLRALGFRARYIWNSEDHVWNEYYSEELKRWVHIDSCEGARGKELLYDLGWGKRMKYCIAFGTSGASDVTRAYISDWQAALARRASISEDRLGYALRDIRQRRRAHLSTAERLELAGEDTAEEAWLQDSKTRLEAAQQESLSGRTSGTKEWRKQRSELGGVTEYAPGLTISTKVVDSTTANMTCNGSARKNGQAIELTADAPGQTGSAFVSLPTTLSSSNFVVTFAFSMSSSSANGADGLAFVLHSAPAGIETLGRGGCDLGYGGIPASIAVELDTYRSEDRCNDPPTPHISVHSRGLEGNDAHHRSSLWCTRPGALPDLADGRTYRLRLEFTEEARQLRIWFTDSEDDFEELTTEAVHLPECLGEQRYIGWTASTGGLHQTHSILSFEVCEAETPVKDAIV